MALRSLALALLLSSPVVAQEPVPAPLPPVQPWTGASEKLVVKPDDPWITPSERTGLTATPSYDETRAWLDRLVAVSPLLRIESFGRTAQGRELYAVVASKPGPNRPVLLVQAGIHSGEIDGKDAGLMLLRDIALKGKDRLLDRATLVFVPIFNADGHERSSPFNRPNQRGPVSQGWRTTAQNLNLNRDYLKADTLEMTAMIALIRKYDPALYLDLHVTDGTDYQYDITFAFSGWDGRYARSPAIGRWLDRRYRPAIERALSRNGHVPGLYVDAVDGRDPDKGIRHDPDTPRFSTGYGDTVHVPTVLVETHSLKSYRRRVLGTYVLVEESLKLVGLEGSAIDAAVAADRAARPRQLTLTWAPLDKPIAEIRDFRGIAHDFYRSTASGRDEVRWLGRPVRQRMPVFGSAPETTVTLPAAWWVPATKPEVIARLKLHGIQHETIVTPRIVAVDMVRLVDPKLSARVDEGHVPLTAAGYAHQMRQEQFPAGSVRVPADQPLGLLAASMLEPESPDSLIAWNFFPEMLQRTEYMEPYVVAPMAERMMAANPALKAEFEAKLAAEPDFAGDPAARLNWFYERSPYQDQRYRLYPVGRELAPAG